MIEAVSNAVVTLPTANTGQTPIELQAPNAADAAKFKNILQVSESADRQDLKIDTAKAERNRVEGVEKNLMERFFDINKSYNARSQHIADIKELIAKPARSEKQVPNIATIDNYRQISEDQRIRTNVSNKNSLQEITENAQSRLLEAAQQSVINREAINDKFIQIAAWRTNMGIFAATLRSMKSGFETLFRSSG